MTTTRITLGDVGRIGVRGFLADLKEPDLIRMLNAACGRGVFGDQGGLYAPKLPVSRIPGTSNDRQTCEGNSNSLELMALGFE